MMAAWAMYHSILNRERDVQTRAMRPQPQGHRRNRWNVRNRRESVASREATMDAAVPESSRFCAHGVDGMCRACEVSGAWQRSGPQVCGLLG